MSCAILGRARRDVRATLLAKRIKELRMREMLTQAQLATLVLVPASAVSEYEEKKRMPSVHTLALLVQALGTSADYLLGTGGAE